MYEFQNSPHVCSQNTMHFRWKINSSISYHKQCIPTVHTVFITFANKMFDSVAVGSVWSSMLRKLYYYHHKIGSVSLSHCCHIFLWLCTWGGCTIICCPFHVYIHIYIYTYSGKVGFSVLYYCAVLRCVQIIKYITTRWPYPFLCTSHYLIIIIMQSRMYLTSILEVQYFQIGLHCRPIWKYWTSKMFVMYTLPQVCLRLSPFSQLSFMQYMGLCVLSAPIYLIMNVRLCVLYLIIIIIIKSEVLPICHFLGLGHETIVCTVCHFIFPMPCGLVKHHQSGLTLAQVKVCCLTAPSLYLNQFWLIVNGVYTCIHILKQCLTNVSQTSKRWQNVPTTQIPENHKLISP